jgi:hypothetical protein
VADQPDDLMQRLIDSLPAPPEQTRADDMDGYDPLGGGPPHPAPQVDPEPEEARVCETCGSSNGHTLDCPTLPDCGCRDDHVSWCPHFHQPATKGDEIDAD